MSRTIAIGDIHGCRAALRAVLTAVAPTKDDTIVVLGDVIDRGPESCGAIDELLALSELCTVIALRGNHEEMLLDGEHDAELHSIWLRCGGEAMLRSYGPSATRASIPDRHWEFVRGCRLYYETPTHIFVHANYLPEAPMAGQDPRLLVWLSLREFVPGPHVSGKTVVVGHTPQPEVLDLGHLLDIDTGCYKGGWLTALDVATRQVWQADAQGGMR